MHRAWRFFLSAQIVLLIAIAAFGQDEIRVDVRLVNLIATVTDAAGRYVGNLKAEDFIIEEDGVPQDIAHFTQDHDLPVSVGIILDSSGSMEGTIRTARLAVERFIRTIHEDDDIFLMTFSSEPILRQDFTSDRTQLSRSLMRVRVTGETALYDALRDGLVKIRDGQHDKRALLVITDGQDTSSSTTLNEILRTIWRSDLVVYSLGISPVNGRRSERRPFSWPVPDIFGGNRNRRSSGSRDAVNIEVLQEFAESSGGRSFLLSESYLAGGSAQMDRALTQIADELRSQYTLGYYRTTPDDGKFHRVRIRSRHGHIVRARQGYLAVR